MKRILLPCLLLSLASGPAFPADTTLPPVDLPQGSQGSIEQHEARLAEHLLALQSQAPSEAARRWLLSLSKYLEQGQRPHPEGRGQSLPARELASRARVLLREWTVQQRLAAWQQDPAAARRKMHDPDEQQARARWLANASEAQLQAFRSELEPRELDEASLLVLLRRQPDAELAQTLALTGESRGSLQWLQEMAHTQAPETALAVLKTAQGNPALRSLAARLRGELASQYPPERQALLQQIRQQPLSAELIESALAARMAELPGLLHSRLDEPEQAALALWGLWREGSPEARELLRQFASSEQAPAHLRQELSAWAD